MLDGEGDVTAWIKRLVEGASAFPLAQRSWHQLVELTASFAQRAFCLSVLAESLLSRSPPTSGSLPDGWALGTSSSGKRRALALTPGLASLLSTDDLETADTEPAPEPPRDFVVPSDEPITIAAAARMAELLHKSGQTE